MWPSSAQEDSGDGMRDVDSSKLSIAEKFGFEPEVSFKISNLPLLVVD